MGCGASADADKNKSRSNEDPELMGKAKFLSCPSMSEVVDPAGVKWLVMVFAPLTHHGLIFVARNSKDGSLLVKDIPDKQVAKEKDDQKVQLSYNLFFKAISTEVAKANRSGAKVEWMPDGTMTVECKIAISGSTTTNKKADTYLATLTPVESSDANLFKYVLEPMATHYTKKRTDGWNLDRPDPHKEKVYGDQESNAILRAASMRVSQKVLDSELPNILPLRQEHALMRAERDVAVAKINLMKQMLAYGTVKPPLLTFPPDDVFAACSPATGGFNVIAATQDPHLAYPTPGDALLGNPLAVAHEPVTAADIAFRGDALEYAAEIPALDTDFPLQTIGMASFSQMGLIGSGEGQFDERSVNKFLYRVDCCHRRTNAFHNAKRAAERMHAFHCLLWTATQQGFKPSKEALAAGLVAAAIHDVDHCGLNNQHGSLSALSAYVPTLYSFESQTERHSLAVGLAEAANCGLRVNVDAVAAAVLATDLSKHQDFMQRFGRRVKEVADFSRRFDDQILAMSALLKVADLCHLYKRKEHCQKSLGELASELRSADELSGLDPSQSSSSGDIDLFVVHVARPFFAATVSAFPCLHFIAAGCDANFVPSHGR